MGYINLEISDEAWKSCIYEAKLAGYEGEEKVNEWIQTWFDKWLNSLYTEDEVEEVRRVLWPSIHTKDDGI